MKTKMQYGDVIRYHWNGRKTTVAQDVPANEAHRYIESTNSKNAFFDDFLAKRWGFCYTTDTNRPKESSQ